jgi:predicted nucleic acid-binding Zn ribbon protein
MDRERKPWADWERERAYKKKHRDGDSGGKVVPLADALQQWVRQSGVESKLNEADVISRWAELVGPTVAAQSEPISLTRGRLVLKVSSGSWRHELLYMRKQLIASINDAVGERVVREIVLTG